MRFTDRGEFAMWLFSQPFPNSVAIHIRSALRGFPLVVGEIGVSKGAEKLALLTGRAIMTAAVAHKWPTDDLKQVASNASRMFELHRSKLEQSVAKAAAEAAGGAALLSGAITGFDTPYFAADISEAVYLDADISADDPFTVDLWHSKGLPNSILEQWDRFQTLTAQDSPWLFWREWYQRFLDAKPVDWYLQKQIALIPNEDWEHGPEHIAQKIEEIKAQFLSEQIPLSEEMRFNTDTGKFFVKPVPARKPDLLATTLEKVSDALDDALNGHNGLSREGREVRVLIRCLDKYSHNPERVEMDFMDAHASLARQTLSGELPDSEEILSLQDTLKNGALDIRASHPEIAKNRETRAEQAMRELSSDQKEQLQKVQPLLEALTEGEANEDFGSDIRSLVNDAIGPLPEGTPPLGPAIRTFNRAAKITTLMKLKKFDAKLVEKCGYKSGVIIFYLLSIVRIGLAVFSLI